MSPRYLLAAAGLIAGCGSAESPAPASAGPPAPAPVVGRGGPREGAAAVAVRLVDSAQTGSELGMEEVASYRVEVTAGGRRDTLAGVRVQQAPALAPDGAVHGVSVGAEGEVAGTFRYDPATRTVARTPAPADASPSFSELTPSPDGRHVAYVAQESGPVVRLWAVVRAWPGGRVVARTAPAPGYPSDVNYSQVRWTGPDAYEVAYRVGGMPGDAALAAGPWLRLRGSTRGGGRARVDTLTAGPGAAAP